MFQKIFTIKSLIKVKIYGREKSLPARVFENILTFIGNYYKKHELENKLHLLNAI